MDNLRNQFVGGVATLGSKEERVTGAAPGVRVSFLSSLREWESFLRARILASIILTMITGATLAARSASWIDAWSMAGLISLTLIVVGAVIFNQVLESGSDRLMPRTARRPIAAGKLTSRAAIRLGALLTVLGGVGLLVSGTVLLTLLGLMVWGLYVGVYTPLKKRTVWQTPIGAVVGASPVLLGAGLVDGYHVAAVWTLCGVIFFWQFPHAMAIAELYREQFAQAGIRVASVADPSGRMTRVFTICGLVGLVACIFLSLITGGLSGRAAGLLILATAYLARPCGTFLHQATEATSRRLLRHSLVYLLLVLIVFVLFR